MLLVLAREASLRGRLWAQYCLLVAWVQDVVERHCQGNMESMESSCRALEGESGCGDSGGGCDPASQEKVHKVKGSESECQQLLQG